MIMAAQEAKVVMETREAKVAAAAREAKAAAAARDGEGGGDGKGDRGDGFDIRITYRMIVAAALERSVIHYEGRHRCT